MKTIIAMISMLAVTAAHAHESLVPHTHPHGISWLPDVETFGIAALILSLAVIAYVQFKSR